MSMKEFGPMQGVLKFAGAAAVAVGAIACAQSPEDSPQPETATPVGLDADRGEFVSNFLTIIPDGTEIVQTPGERYLRRGTEKLREQIPSDVKRVVQQTLQSGFADLVLAGRTMPKLDVAAEKATVSIDDRFWGTQLDSKYNIWAAAKPSSLLFPLGEYRSGGSRELPFNLFVTYEENPEVYEAYKKEPYFTGRKAEITQYRLETVLNNANYYEELQPFVFVKDNQTHFKPDKLTEVMEAVFQLPEGLRWKRFVHQFHVTTPYNTKPQTRYLPGLMATAILPDGKRLEAYILDGGRAWVEVTEPSSTALPYSVRFEHRINPLEG